MGQYAIGDVHGCLTALETLVDFVDPSPSDLLVMLGDYVDRGPDSSGVLQWLIDQSPRRNMICLRGNHEVMMMESRQNMTSRVRWGQHGGGETWDSYDEESSDEGLAIVPDEHWEFLDSLRSYHETETHVFVHAAAYGDIPMNKQPEFVLYWERFGMISARDDGKVVVCGHTRQISGVPRRNEHAICIDTNACRGGWLTCLDVESGRYYQANERKETRVGWIDELDIEY